MQLFSRFCVMSVSLFSSSFWMLFSLCNVCFNSLISCLKFSSFERGLAHVALLTMLDLFMFAMLDFLDYPISKDQ